MTPPPTEESFDDTWEVAHGASVTSPAGPGDADDGGTSRINLRLPDSLKLRAEAAAGQEGLSVNTWLVRAVAAALDPENSGASPGRRTPRSGQRYTGWVR